MSQTENMNTNAQDPVNYEQRGAEEVKKSMEATYTGKKCSEDGDHTAQEKRNSGETQVPEKYIPRSDEELKADMERTYTSKNCTEEGDCTSKDKRDMKEAPDIAGFARVVNQIIPDFAEIVQRCIMTTRQEGKIVYSDRAIIITAVLGLVLGIGSVSMVTSILNTSEGIENLCLILKQKGLSSVPNYSTIRNALTEIVHCEAAFNATLDAMIKELLRSRRYDNSRPYLAFMTMEKDENGNFIQKVKKCIPVIGDGTETHRQKKQMSPNDLVCVKRNKEDKDRIESIEYYHKFEVFLIEISENHFLPLRAYVIENKDGYDFTRMVNQDTEKVKQECELNIGKIAIQELNEAFKEYVLLYQFDGLYLNRPVLKAILSAENCYMITFKEGCASALYNVGITELKKRVAEFKEGRTKLDPFKTFDLPGELHCKVACIEDIGGLSGDLEWAEYPINFVRATVEGRKVIYDEARKENVNTNRGRAEARKQNEEHPLPDFEKEKCIQQLKEYISNYNSFLNNIPFDDLIKDLVFVQTRDPRTGYRIVEVIYQRTFTWATNIILDLNNHKEIKELLSDKLLNAAAAKKSEGHRMQRKNYVKNYMLKVVNQARKRWAIEEFFNILKNGNMRIEIRKSRSYAAEKAYFYIALIAQFLLTLYRRYDRYAAKALKTYKTISLSLLASFIHDKLEDYKEYYTKRTCLRDQLIE